jgi:predicted MFS family arabinose efflux permease
MNPTAVLVCGCLILCLGFGIRASMGLFLQPMSQEFGWGREVFSFAMAFQNLVWGVLAAFSGAIAERYGGARVVAACGLLYVLGLIVMAFANTPLSLYLGGGFFIGLALTGTTFGVAMAVIARVTPAEQRSTALGMATAASSLGQFLLLPLCQFLIQKLDWHGALLGLALVAALIVPLSVTMKGRPPARPGGDQTLRAALREAWSERSFHLLFWGYFVCGFQLMMFTVHLPAFVTDAGLAPRHGMIALALIGLCNAIGSFIAGWLGGRFSKKHLLAIIYLVRAAIIVYLILVPLTPFTLYVFAVSMGLLWLSTVPLTNGLVAQIFGLRYMATLTGLVFFGHQIGSFLGVWLAGYLYDTTGSYNGAFMISIALGVFAALVNLPVDQRPIAERRAAAAA